MKTHAQKRNTLTRLMVLLLIALGVALIVVQRYTPSDNQKESANQADIQHISISLPDKPLIELQRLEHSNAWQMNKPVHLPGQNQRIEPLVNLLSQFEGSYELSEVKLEDAGLKPSRASITINNTAFLIGGKDLSGERRYALYNDKIGFVPEWTLSLITGGISALAHLNVFERLARPTHLLDSAGGTIELENPGNWQMLTAEQIVSTNEVNIDPKAIVFKVLSKEPTEKQLGELFVQQPFSLLKLDETFVYVLSNTTINTLLPNLKR